MTRSARNKPDHTPLVNRAMPLFCSKLCRPKKVCVCVCVCMKLCIIRAHYVIHSYTQIPREGLDKTHVHSILQELVQCLYKGICAHYIIENTVCVLCELENDQKSSKMLTEGLLFLVRLTLSSVHHYFNPVPPPLSQILTLFSLPPLSSSSSSRPSQTLPPSLPSPHEPHARDGGNLVTKRKPLSR